MDQVKHLKPSLSRRDFIKASGAVATGAAVPTLVPEGVIGRRGKPGANDRIVYAHIGVGGMGQTHVVKNAAALCEVDADQLARVIKRVEGNPFLCSDYRRILDRKDIDAITIGTPDHWHAIMAVHACQAGKDVYSEKPTCRTIQEGQAMINATNHYKRVMQIGAQGRSSPAHHATAQFIRNGQIGKVNRVEVWHPANFTTDWGEEDEPPDSLEWLLWLGPARLRRYNKMFCPFNFRWIMDVGGGSICGHGNDILSIVFWSLGADDTGPVSVEATGEPSKESCWDVPVTMKATWEFKNPDWTLTWEQPGTPRSFPGSTKLIDWGAKFYGDRDTLMMSGGDGSGECEPKAREYQPPADGVHLFLDPADADPTERHRQNWRKCIVSREKPAMPIEIGHRVNTLPIIANISYLLGRKLNWDATQQRFIGDEEANRFLATPYRAPWSL